MSTFPVNCGVCGIGYTVKKLKPSKPRHTCQSCKGKRAVRIMIAGFVVPDSDESQRERANGLINQRVKRGLVERPNACQKCNRETRLDSHHPDYSKPGEVLWLCRSCHMKAHHRPEILRGLRLMDTGPAGEPVGDRREWRTGKAVTP